MKKYKKLVFISLIALIIIGSSIVDFLYGTTISLLLGIATAIIAMVFIIKSFKDFNYKITLKEAVSPDSTSDITKTTDTQTKN